LNIQRTFGPLGVLVVTIGGALIAVQQAGQLPDLDLRLKQWGTGTTLLGFVLLGFAALVKTRASAKTASFKRVVLHFRGTVTYEVEQATVSDLDFLYSRYEELFGLDLVPKQDFASWIIRNPKICFKIIKVNRLNADYSTKIVGFFDFEPLTTAALNRLLRTKPTEIPKPLSITDIRTAKSPAKGYYIGSIGATSRSTRDKGATLLTALDFARKLNQRNSVTLFANPFTDDGLRLCETFGFSPLNPDRKRGLWKLHLPAGFQIEEYEIKIRRLLVG